MFFFDSLSSLFPPFPPVHRLVAIREIHGCLALHSLLHLCRSCDSIRLVKVPTAMFALALASALVAPAAIKPTAVRKPDEDVDSAAVRNRQGLSAGRDLLFNGWGVSPAGQHVSCGELALKILIAPAPKAAIAVGP